MRNDMIIMIVLMAVVTYIPRALPAFIIDKICLSKRMERFLGLIPFTAMSALIFPAIINVDAEMPIVGIIGGTVAAIVAFFRLPVIVSVISAVMVNFIIYLLV